MSLSEALLLDSYPFEVWIAVRTDGVGGSGTAADPYDGSTYAKFDAVMASIPENMKINLGPGVFETRGYTYSYQSWKPKSGQKIVGSGMGATTLKLVNASVVDAPYWAIGVDYNNFLVAFEVSDLTIDCNLPGQPIPSGDYRAPVTCSAIGVTGRDIRIRRVRAINFGTQTLANETFVIGGTGAHPWLEAQVPPLYAINCIIEDCVIEHPAENNFRENTVLHFGAGEVYNYGGVTAFHRSCVIRNCYVNCQFPSGHDGQRIKIQSLAVNSGLQYRLTADAPHFQVPVGGQEGWPKTVVLANVTVSLKVEPSLNGPFKVDQVLSSSELLFTVKTAPPPGSIDTFYAFVAFNFQALSIGGGIGAVAEGNRVFNCLTGGPYHDTFSSRDVLARNNYYFNVLAGPTENLAGIAPLYDDSRILLGSLEYDDSLDVEDFVSLSFVDYYENGIGVAKTLIPHGFSLAEAPGNSPSTVIVSGASGIDGPLYSGSGEVLSVPDPFTFSYQMSGRATLPTSGAKYNTGDRQRQLSSITAAQDSLGKWVATAEIVYTVPLNFTNKHGFEVGDAVYISKVGPNAPFYNGNHEIIAVTDDATFQFYLDSDPGTPGPNFSPGYYGRIYQVRHIDWESNVIILTQQVVDYGPPSAMVGYANIIRSPWTFDQAVFRDNLVREIEPGSVRSGYGIDVNSVGELILDRNLISITSPTDIRNGSTGEGLLFQNQTMEGALVGVTFVNPPTALLSDIETEIEDALTLAFLK